MWNRKWEWRYPVWFQDVGSCAVSNKVHTPISKKLWLFKNEIKTLFCLSIYIYFQIIFSINWQNLFVIYYVPSTIQRAGDTLINKTEDVHDLTELTFRWQWGETGNMCMNKKIQDNCRFWFKLYKTLRQRQQDREWVGGWSR